MVLLLSEQFALDGLTGLGKVPIAVFARPPVLASLENLEKAVFSRSRPAIALGRQSVADFPGPQKFEPSGFVVSVSSLSLFVSLV